MKKIYLAATCFLIIIQTSRCQDKFLQGSIQKNDKLIRKGKIREYKGYLKENANIVIREDEMRFKILAKNKAMHYVHYVVTILNENGNGYAEYAVGYDKLIKVIDFNGTVYDAEGKQIKRLKNKDIIDRAAYDGFSLYSDNRIKTVDLTQATYPYTVELEYELEYKFLYYIPSSWWGGEKSSYQKASYQLIYPPELAPRFQLFNSNVAPIKQIENGFETLTWSLQNIKPVKLESYGPPASELIPHIIAAPNDFDFEGYVGKMDSWQNFGKWVSSLNKGRDVLSEETKKKVAALTKDLKTKEEKVKVLYEYMQSKTRYVSIQLGIGGFQPFEALTVDNNGYGDCKALSNYMVALLKEAGIPANYILIYAGSSPRFNTAFPSTQFNHAIAAVPNGRDTLWLECTSQTNPFGYQGTFTGDRKALMITDQGAKIVNTINYKPEDNLQNRIAEVSIDAAGNGKAKIRTIAKATQYEENRLDNVLSNVEAQKKWIQNNTDIPNFTINSFSMAEKRDKIPSAIVNLDLTLNRYATVSGKRLFIVPNLMNRITRVPEKITERKTDVVRNLNYLDLDTIKFTLPENLYPEFLPTPTKINSKFGEYEASVTFEAGKVIYIRRMKVWKGRFPKETYNELVDFYKSVSKADNTKLVFLNKT
jgi:transglutaminase-like putative cysteine protease